VHKNVMDKLFVEKCDGDVISQYLKMVAYSAQDVGSIPAFMRLKEENDKCKSLVSSHESRLAEYESEVKELKALLAMKTKYLFEMKKVRELNENVYENNIGFLDSNIRFLDSYVEFLDAMIDSK